MADIALTTAGRIEVVGIPEVLRIRVADETLTPGDAVRDSTTNGRSTRANGTSTAEARAIGIAVAPKTSIKAGEAVTVIRRGILSGYDLSALAFDAPVYLSNTDGKLADAAGTNTVIVGRVVPGLANQIGSAHDKLLDVNL